jgi:hypothetical protein
MTWDIPALLPIREEGVLRIFIALKNPSPWLGFEPATFGSSGQHTSHYTTKATTWNLTFRTRIISFTRKTNSVRFNYYVSNVIILRSDCIKGIMLDSRLYFHCHVDFVHSQALRDIGVYTLCCI